MCVLCFVTTNTVDEENDESLIRAEDDDNGHDSVVKEMDYESDRKLVKHYICCGYCCFI